MATSLPAAGLATIEDAIRAHPGGASLGQIAATLGDRFPTRTLQRHLRSLTDAGRIVRRGERRGAKYRVNDEAPPVPAADDANAPLSAATHIASWTGQHIGDADRERFRDLAEREIVGLHEGDFARYRIRPSDFTAWQAVWGSA